MGCGLDIPAPDMQPNPGGRWGSRRAEWRRARPAPLRDTEYRDVGILMGWRCLVSNRHLREAGIRA